MLFFEVCLQVKNFILHYVCTSACIVYAYFWLSVKAANNSTSWRNRNMLSLQLEDIWDHYLSRIFMNRMDLKNKTSYPWIWETEDKYNDLCWLEICCFLLAVGSSIENKQPIENQCLFSNHIKWSKRDSICFCSKISAEMSKLKTRGTQPRNACVTCTFQLLTSLGNIQTELSHCNSKQWYRQCFPLP